MSDIDVGIDQTDHISFFCPDCSAALTVTDVGTSEVVVNARTDERDQCTWIHTYCGQCKAVKGHRKFYWTSDDGSFTERMSTLETERDEAREELAEAEKERDEALAAIERAGAEIARLKAGGCARDQTTTQFCAEALALAKERDEVLKRVYSVDSIIEANRDAALEAVRQWREVAERLDAWVHALAPRVESHPHEYDDNLVHAVTEFDRLSKGQP